MTRLLTGYLLLAGLLPVLSVHAVLSAAETSASSFSSHTVLPPNLLLLNATTTTIGKTTAETPRNGARKKEGGAAAALAAAAAAVADPGRSMPAKWAKMWKAYLEKRERGEYEHGEENDGPDTEENGSEKFVGFADKAFDAADWGRHVQALHEALPAKKLRELAKKHRKAYQHAKPFPHIAFDDLFPEEFLLKLGEEFPEHLRQEDMPEEYSCTSRPPGESGRYEDADCERGKCSGFENKGAAIFEKPYASAMYSLLLSPIFTQNFLEPLTGIEGIVSDTEFDGSGFDQTPAGGALAIHTDFNEHGIFGLDRRVNVFLYLSPDWEEENGGHLELWEAGVERNQAGVSVLKPKRLGQRYVPSFNRLFIFNSDDYSFHGHPIPLPDKGRTRRSIAQYYYTNGRPEKERFWKESVSYFVPSKDEFDEGELKSRPGMVFGSPYHEELDDMGDDDGAWWSKDDGAGGDSALVQKGRRWWTRRSDEGPGTTGKSAFLDKGRRWWSRRKQASLSRRHRRKNRDGGG